MYYPVCTIIDLAATSKYSRGEKSLIFLVSRSFTQNITDFCPRLYVSINIYDAHRMILVQSHSLELEFKMLFLDSRIF